MANGDLAATFGFVVVKSTDDYRLGYDAINQSADFAAKLAAETAGAPNPPGTAATTVALISGKVRKVNKRVVLQLYLSTTATAAALMNTTIWTLPVGYRPEMLSHFGGGCHVGGAASWLPVDYLVNVDGTISFQGTTATGTLDRLSASVAFDVA